MSKEVEVKQVTLVSVGAYSRALIKYAHENGKNLTNEEMAKKVVSKFKEHGVEVKTSANCIAWYKNDMRKKGLLPKGGAGGKAIDVKIEEISLE